MPDPVLVPRPRPGTARTVDALKARGFAAIAYPLFAVEPVAWAPPDPAGIDALLITSGNALRHAGSGIAVYRPLPLFAVGDATAELARSQGFGAVRTGGGDARTTIPMLAAAGHRHILHLSGTAVRPFDPQGLSITRLPVYRTVATGHAEGLAQALPRDRGVFALVHSPRLGARLSELVTDQARARITIVAISPAASEACGTGWRGRVAAGEPTEAAMLAGLCALV